jgi:hypothetical protein
VANESCIPGKVRLPPHWSALRRTTARTADKIPDRCLNNRKYFPTLQIRRDIWSQGPGRDSGRRWLITTEPGLIVVQWRTKWQRGRFLIEFCSYRPPIIISLNRSQNLKFKCNSSPNTDIMMMCPVTYLTAIPSQMYKLMPRQRNPSQFSYGH